MSYHYNSKITVSDLEELITDLKADWCCLSFCFDDINSDSDYDKNAMLQLCYNHISYLKQHLSDLEFFFSLLCKRGLTSFVLTDDAWKNGVSVLGCDEDPTYETK